MMTRLTGGVALLLAATLASPVTAQPTVSVSSQSGKADAIRVLLDQSAYWRSKSETKLADEALARVLALDPGNIDALAVQAQAAADRGDRTTGQAALAKLQAARPDDPRIASIQQALTAPPIDQTALAEARRLGGSTKQAPEAVAAYRQAFHGNTPPPALALEYYEALNGTEGNWDEARAGLAGVVRNDPQNLHAQLVYAQALTYHEGTRSDGIDRLIALTQIPDVADAARQSWHNAILWSGDDDRTMQQLTTYLSRYPGDGQLEAKRAEIQATTPDAGTKDRLEGYQAMENHNYVEAERRFQASLAFNKDDVFSMAMMAVIRHSQNKDAEAKALIARISELAPDRKEELLQQTGLDKIGTPQAQTNTGGNGGTTGYNGNGYRGRGGAGDGGLLIRRGYERVAALTRRGEFAAAEAELRRLAGPRPNAGNTLLLGDIQARAGKLAEADASFRAVLRSQPRNGAAMGGLAGVLSREGKTDEANAMFASAQSAGGGNAIGASRADLLRRQAQSVSDPEARTGLFRAAVAADNANPWLKLELSRALLEQGKGGEARQVMDPILQTSRPTTDQLRSAIYYAETANDYPLVATLVQRLPASARNGDFVAAEQRGLADADLRDARSAGSTPAIRQRMLTLASKPDPSGARATAFARELIRLGDKPGAREVIRTALAAGQPTPQQRLAYSGSLIAAGYPRDAQVVSGGVQTARLTQVERGELDTVQNSAAVVASDQLNGRGDAAQAYDQLAPRLARDPQNPDLNLALARLYAAHNEPRRAAAISEEVVRRDPSNLYARITVLNAATQSGEQDRAARMAAELKQQFPDEPQAFVAAAGAERARGDAGQALRDLQTARALRSKQLASDPASRQPGA